MLSKDIRNEESFIFKAVKDAISFEAEKLVKDAQKELEKRTPEIVASIVIDMMKLADFQVLQDRIVFTIKKSGNP